MQAEKQAERRRAIVQRQAESKVCHATRRHVRQSACRPRVAAGRSIAINRVRGDRGGRSPVLPVASASNMVQRIRSHRLRSLCQNYSPGSYVTLRGHVQPMRASPARVL